MFVCLLWYFLDKGSLYIITIYPFAHSSAGKVAVHAHCYLSFNQVVVGWGLNGNEGCLFHKWWLTEWESYCENSVI